MPNWDYLSKLVKWILSCLVFFALPFLLIAFGFGQRWKVQEKESIDRLFHRLDGILIVIRRREATDAYISALLTKLFDIAEKSNRPIKVLSAGIKVLKERFLGALRFTIVNDEGTAVPSLSDGTLPSHALSKLFQATQAIIDEDPVKIPHFKNYWPILQPLVGKDSLWENLPKKKRQLFDVSFSEKGRRFYFNCSDDMGMFVHADQIPQWPILAIMDQCAQFMKYRGKLGISVGVFDSTRNKATSSVPDLSLAMAEFQHSTRQHIQVGESLFSVMPFTNTACIWARYPLSKALDKSKSRFALILIGVFLFSFFALFSYQRMILGVKMIFPIRWRLVILFGFAGGFPLVVVIQSGWDYLHQKYLSRIRETHDETERALKAFDVRFTQMRGLLETKINLWVKNLQYDTPTAKETAQKRLKKIYERFECSHINLYDGNGKITWNALPENTNKKNRGQRFMGGLVRNIVAKLNNEEKDVPMDMATMALETFSGSENPIINLIRNMSTIMYFGVQEDQNWLFLKTLTGNDGRTTHAVFFYWQSNQMESVYLKHYLLSAQRNLPGTILYAVNTENRSWDFPKKFKFAKRLNRFISDLKLRQTTTYGELSLGTKKYLVTGVKPKELSQILLIAIQSDEPINQEIKLLVNRLWLFSLTSVAISLFLGLILSQRFLLPINQLSEGVGAIQRRDFNHRIPPGEPDELGKLSETFNKVMEGLIDLEVGRIVQESLFPVNEHKVGEFRLYGMTKSATELGGDYFDLQPLSDGRVLILIGDVSGHGVPAALVMAMAKALVERECESSPSPERVLSTLHRIFFKTLKRLRMMTCFMALLDPLRNVVIASNAGHNYPYLFRKSEAPRSLEVRSFPLGSKKNIFFTSETVEIKPGDRILFYTDGLVEAKVGQEPVGYDRMVENIRPLLEDDPRRSCEKIFSWHRALCGDGPQEDDITVALLTRQSA